MKKILFAGGSSMLALNWSFLKKNEYAIILGLHKRQVSLKGTDSLTLNYDSFSKLNNQIKIIEPDIIVNTIAITNIDECEKKPVLCEYVNSHIAAMLSIICKKNNIKYVHISTDHFFSLNQKYYKETDKINCINSYSKTKLLAENKFILNNKSALIIRTNFYCWGTEYRQSITDYIIKNLLKNQTIKLYSDVYYTPIFVETLVDQIDMLIKKNKSGLFHIASKKRITKYDFAIKIAEKFNLEKKFIKPITVDKAQLNTPRPKNMSLSNSKIEEINNFIGSDIDEDINKLFHQRYLL